MGTMTKPLTQEEKDEREAERAAIKGKATAKVPVNIETSINDLEKKFVSFIANIGGGTFSEMVDEARKLQKDGVFEDHVEAVIQLKLGKEGLKLTMGAKSAVTKKVSRKNDWGTIEADPAQQELPGLEKSRKVKPQVATIEAGEINPGSFKPGQDDPTPDAVASNNGDSDESPMPQITEGTAPASAE
jgi:hypothetical protein